MRYAVLIRHGEFSRDDGHLTPEGNEQVEKTAGQLQRRFDQQGTHDIMIMSSPVNRAVESATIIGRALECPVIIEDFVDSQHNDPSLTTIKIGNMLARLQLTTTLDAVVIVGHIHLSRDVLPYLAQHWFDIVSLKVKDVNYGQALVLDQVERRWYTLGASAEAV